MASSADASLEGGLSSMRLAADKYRSILNDEKTGNTRWRYGGPPIFDTVNKLFEAERTHVITNQLFILSLSIALSQLWSFS